MTTLVIADIENGELAASTPRVITAATQLGDSVDVLIAGHQVASAAAQAAGIAGVSRVLKADAPVLADQLAEPMAALVARLASDYSHVLAPASSCGKDLLPRAAASLGYPQLSDIVGVVSAETFKRPIYAGGAIATVTNKAPIKFATVRISAFAAAGASDANAPLSELEVDLENSLSSLVEENRSAASGPQLGSARVVISGGRGVASGENFSLLEALASKLDAAIGASRAAVDAGFVGNDKQVGQTGKIVAPDLYIAVGISGAIQHLAGMKESKVVVAINSDEEAPIFKAADYGLVGDLFELVPALTARL